MLLKAVREFCKIVGCLSACLVRSGAGAFQRKRKGQGPMYKYLWTVLLLGLCFSVNAAAVSRTGFCAAMSTGCTLSAVNAGDLKLVFAYDKGFTKPLLPGGWTSIISANSFGDAFNVGCTVASSSSDRGTDTWINAVGVVAVAYSGTQINGGTDCAAAIGSVAETGQSTSPPIIYPPLTLKDQSGKSWVVGFGGDVATGYSCTPNGMVKVAAVQKGKTKPGVRISDTNHGVSKWAQTSCSVAHTSIWSTVVIEILNSTLAP